MIGNNLKLDTGIGTCGKEGQSVPVGVGHYQYKFSLAMAVDGFKKQAPGYAEAIAAETFNRLLFNPADRLEGRSASDEYPSPLMNFLMDKLGFNAKGQGQ